jgi:hypothetical protein
MINVNYQKRKNTELFQSLEDSDSLFLSKTQNYIPIYKRFFELNDTNYTNINLNHKWFISSINKDPDTMSDSNTDDVHNINIFNCRLKNINNKKGKDKEVFFKMAPLLDPFKYLIGKYNAQDETLFHLPNINSTEATCNHKMLDLNNSAYVDGFFLFLTSNMIHQYNFCHGVDYYGSYLALKNNFVLNVYDDIDYLNNSEFFNKNKNTLFKIDDYDHLFQFQNPEDNIKPIKIDHTSSLHSTLSIQSIDNEIFEDIFSNDNTLITLEDLKGEEVNLIDITKSNLQNETEHTVTLNSTSTCSSRTSYTVDDGEKDEECEHCNSNNYKEPEEESSENEWEDMDDSYEEEEINVIIPKFPVQVISMEYCENTFDDLILSNQLTNDEWFSAFMQIIMILITYQKAFSFTHNDLHSNNIMYNYTDKKYIYYCYKKQYYKVPTFGRIFKIIDFGRSIYKFDGKLFCSDSFQNGNDAASQYNTEPYFNEKKPRLEPNFSFDLCRLACSIFDYVIEDVSEIKSVKSIKDPVKRLVVEWCLDDKGINMLYKNNGQDRYPEFKLYKMIARFVHNHTPQAQLERDEFKAYTQLNGEVPKDFIDIDNIPVLI